ncbi:MAG: hypothetical protein H6946_12590 [Thauera sp.]|uniref:hypothetical protein n=1 Tax=Thauera sp. TaxID=1905334 RepID=UPI002637588C|nr:hypothetical protein [Thauera sp.]MCP5225931.1 hypothetical protein [Thauera sp.]
MTLADTARVLLALRLVAQEYDLIPSDVLSMPIGLGRPTAFALEQCEAAYLGLYESPSETRLLYEIEQLVNA